MKHNALCLLFFIMGLMLCSACAASGNSVSEETSVGEEENETTVPLSPEPVAEQTPEPEKFYDIYGCQVSSLSMVLDFSGIQITDKGESLEEMLPLFPHLEKIIMSDCGISDEDMNALNLRHDDVRFIWTVYFATYYLRTDATYFIASLFNGSQSNFTCLRDSDVECLKYCTDMEALDLGHMQIYNCEFCRYMPNLRYLILACTPVSDLSPLAGLQNLFFLEIFLTNVRDISPLLECPNLKNLNASWTYLQNAQELTKMVWLDRLWMVNSYISEEDRNVLSNSLPNTEKVIRTGGESTGFGWRNTPAFYEMRDALDSYYSAG